MGASPPPSSPEVAEVGFRAAFEGRDVQNGSMNARDFAPSVLAMSGIVEEAAAIYFDDPGIITLDITSDFRAGSFDFGMVATAGKIAGTLFANLSVSDIQALLNGIGFIGRNTKSLLRLLLKYGSAQVTKIEPTSDGLVNLHVEGDNNVVVIGDVDRRVAKLAISQPIREAIPRVAAPLRKEGVDSLRYGTKARANLRLVKDDLPKLVPPPSFKTELTDSVSETAIEILSPNFVNGNKWRVSQGGEPFWVRIMDEAYLQAVDIGATSFAKGDYLIVRLRTRAYSTVEGMAVDRDVMEVIEHRHRAKQLGLV